MASDYQFIRLEFDGPAARLTLSRPPLNVISIAVMRELQDALAAVESRAPKLLVISATGRAFCAGTDIGEHLPEHAPVLLAEFRQVIVQLLGLSCASLVVVHGDALGGGCELVSACDLAVAAQEARLGQPEVTLGVFPPIANVLLPRLVGPRRAAELILTGEPISADQAVEWGLVNRAVPHDRLEPEVEQLVQQLLAKSGPALRLARRALAGISIQQLRAELEAMETSYLRDVVPLPDAQEGLRSFLEKRAPRWS